MWEVPVRYVGKGEIAEIQNHPKFLPIYQYPISISYHDRELGALVEHDGEKVNKVHERIVRKHDRPT